MRKNIANYLDNAITFLVLVIAGITPLIFLNQTTEFFEMPKLVFLVVMTIVLIGLWIFSWIVKGKIVIVRTPLDIPLLILLAVIIASTYFSGTKYASLYGNFPRVNGSAVSWVTYILLYFVTVSSLKTIGRIKTFIYVLLGSALIISLLNLCSFFGFFLPMDFAKSVNFTPTGGTFSTIAFLLLLLPIPLLSITNKNKFLPVPLAVVLSSLFSITVVLIGSIPTYVALIIIYVLALIVTKPQQIKKKIGLFLIPVVITFLTFVAAYLPLPGQLGAVQQIEAKYPKEIQLPFSISWKVSASAFRDAPFLGTGPSTYLFNFTAYKPAEYNKLNYWNISFDTATNEFLQALGTLGILGVVALIAFCLVILNISRKNFSFDREDAQHDQSHILVPALAISGLVGVILLAIHVTTLVSIVLTVFIVAAFMMSQRSIRERVMDLSIGIKASTSDNKQFDLLPIIIFIVYLILAIPVLYKTYNIVSADYYHRQALVQASKSGNKTYEYLQKAEALNPYIDLYRVDLAQTNFALANAIAVKKGPTKDNPKGSLTDKDKKTIQTLISQSINEGKASIVLSPRSARNWEVLASIYRNITGVAKNALTFSLDAYSKAIQRDPLNPMLRVNVGGIYYSIKSYDNAIRYFSDAINLKPDYANAYFNLSIALRDKGDLRNATLVAEQTVTLLQKNNKSNDYKVATKLLDNLKAKLATTSAQQAPAAATSSALQNPNLPKTNDKDLNNPPQLTPAPTVSKNPAAKIPQPSVKAISPSVAPTRRTTR